MGVESGGVKGSSSGCKRYSGSGGKDWLRSG